jgi:hypothetical protein
MKPEHRWLRTITATLLLPALVIAALWFPFGFSLGGLVEEWDVLFLFARHGVFFLADHSSPLQIQQARPLTILPQAIAYTLNPNSFFYWHIIQAGSLLVKGFSAGVIGMYLTRNQAQAALLALLTMLYPADTMQLSFRSLHINWAVALALVASVLVLLALHTDSRRSRIILAAIASIIFGSALLMYEVVIGLAALPFFVFFARASRAASSIIRKRLDLCIIWVAMIAAWFTFFVWAVETGSQYQLSALSRSNYDTIIPRLKMLASSGLYRAFYECWTELFGQILGSLSNAAYVLCFVAVNMILFSWLAYEPTNAATNNTKLALRIVTVGLISFLLAYAPYLSDESHLLLTQRVFLVAAIGAALVLLGCMMLLSRVLPQSVVTALSVLLISGCFVAQLYQFDKYNRIYATVTKPVLAAVIPFISKSADRSYSVLFNDYGYLSGVWDLGLELQVALGYLLPEIKADYILICESRSGRLLPRLPGPISQRRSCQQTGDEVAIAEPSEPAVPLKDAAIGKLSPDGVVSVGRTEIAASNTPLPKRVLQLFALSNWHPTNSFFRARHRADHFECQFESMWGYASPCRTFGFYDAVPYRTNLASAYAWIGETHAGLLFDIDPKRGNYQLTIKTVDAVSPSRRLKIELNGTELPKASDSSGYFSTSFSSDLLQPQNNVLEFDTDLDNKLGLSFAIERISIIPAESSRALRTQGERRICRSALPKSSWQVHLSDEVAWWKKSKRRSTDPVTVAKSFWREKHIRCPALECWSDSALSCNDGHGSGCSHSLLQTPLNYRACFDAELS